MNQTPFTPSIPTQAMTAMTGNKLDLSKIPTPALERWLDQYESFVAQTKAELDKRLNPELKLKETTVEIEME